MQQTGAFEQKNKNSPHTSPRQSIDPYSSIGKMIPSKLPSAPEYSMGKADRDIQKKLFVSEDFAKTDLRGTTYTAAPNSYFPSEKILQKSGKKTLVLVRNKETDSKYQKAPAAIIGKEVRDIKQNFFSHYSNTDELNPNEADIRRKHRSSSVFLGTDRRFESQNPDRITPSPFEYKPQIGIQFNNPPKYSFIRKVQSQSKLSRNETPSKKKRKLNSKFDGPGPGSYFTQQKPISKLTKTRSQSVNFLRAPQNSNMKSIPFHKIPMGQRSNIGTSRHGYMEQTYDIKTKTIMANYDFQHDGGKGQHSGLGWLKDRIVEHSKVALDKNKMRSYSIGKTQRGQPLRGIFQAHMQFKHQPIRIEHPKF